MSSLRDIQSSCYDAFSSADDPLPKAVLVDKGIPLATRVSVYRNNTSETFRKTLASTFPVVEQLVGNACFRSLAQEFARENPSASGDLQNFGASFPLFMASQYGDSEFGYLGDVARLELAIETALLLPDCAALGIESLADIPESELAGVRIATAPSLQLLSSLYPVLEIWRANQPGDHRTVDLSEGEQQIAVLRRRDEVEIHPIDVAAFALLAQFHERRSFGEAFEAIGDEFGPKLGHALRVLFDMGSIAGIDHDASP